MGAIESDVVASEVNMQKTRPRPAEGMVGVQRQALIYETEPFFRTPASGTRLESLAAMAPGARASATAVVIEARMSTLTAERKSDDQSEINAW